MKPLRAILLTSLLCLGACTSSLRISVERYDTNAGRDHETTARDEYLRIHGAGLAAEEKYSALLDLRDAITAFEAYVLALNEFAIGLELEGAEAKAELAKVKEHAAESLAGIRQLVASEIERSVELIQREGVHARARSTGTEFEIAWRDALSRMRSLDAFQVDGSRLSALIQQLSTAGFPKLEALGNEMANRLETIEALPGARKSGIAGRLQRLAKGLRQNAPDLGELMTTVAVELTSISVEGNRETIEQVRQLKGAPMDLVPRLHQVYQDMGDPYIAYIASHPEHWEEIPNGARVYGDGDTEYVLVFDGVLDAHWKQVSVDPTKVIQARARLLRRTMALGMAAATGFYTGSIGITGGPNKPSSGGAMGGGDGEVQLNELSMKQKLVEAHEKRLRGELAELQRWAMRRLIEVGELDPTSPDIDRLNEIRKDIKRRIDELYDIPDDLLKLEVPDSSSN